MSARPLLGQRLLAAARLARWEREVAAAAIRALARRKAHVFEHAYALATAAVTAAGDDFGTDDWDADVADEVVPAVTRIVDEINAAVVGRFVLDDAEAAAVLGRIDASRTVDAFVSLVRGIGPDGARRIHAALAEGVGLGESIPEIAARVDGVIAMMARRATTIARTETNRAANTGLNAAAGEIAKDLPLTKTWMATEDERTREDHADADGQTVAYDEPFDVGGESPMYPCDPVLSAENSINCRCVLTFDLAADATAEQGEQAQQAEAAAD